MLCASTQVSPFTERLLALLACNGVIPLVRAVRSHGAQWGENCRLVGCMHAISIVSQW